MPTRTVSDLEKDFPRKTQRKVFESVSGTDQIGLQQFEVAMVFLAQKKEEKTVWDVPVSHVHLVFRSLLSKTSFLSVKTAKKRRGHTSRMAGSPLYQAV